MVPQETAVSVNWPSVLTFLLIALGLPWLIQIPVWVSGGIMPNGELNPLFLPLTTLMMFTPAVAAVIVVFTLQKPTHPTRFLGLVPLRPWRRTLGYSALSIPAGWALGVLSILVASAVGVVDLQTSPATLGLLLGLPVASLGIAVLAFGEELGWRGYLLPALRPLGTWPALILHGAVWGIWHAPIVLLGYNYGLTSPLGVLLMTVFTVLIGFLFGWLRMRTGSVWPSTFAHGAINASAGTLLVALLPAADAGNLAASPLGWIGWVLIALITVVLAITRTFRWAPQAAPRGVGPVAEKAPDH